MSPRIDVQFAVNSAGLPDRKSLQHWASTVLADSAEETEVTIRIVGEREGTELNRTYRNVPSATNVLAFPFEAPDVVDLLLLGDVVICAPVVERETLAQNKTGHAHWAHMVVHGVLHLVGYDHVVAADAQVMESRERDLLAGLGFSDPYATEDVP